MFRNWGILLALVLLGACSMMREEPAKPEPAPAPVEEKPIVTEPEPQSQESQLASLSDADLCETYGERQGDMADVRRELIARALFTETEWRYINDRSVVRGMSECAVNAALSGRTEKIVNVTYSNGDKGRTLFYSCRRSAAPHCPYTRINIRNGRVVSVSRVDFVE